MGDTLTHNTDHIQVKLWLNEKTHKVLHIPVDTTCAQLSVMVADLLNIPPSIQSYFAIYQTVNGVDQGIVNESEHIAELQRRYQLNGAWGESQNNGFGYHVDEKARAHLLPEGALNREPATFSQSRNTHRAAVLAGRKGIGHQRSRSNPHIPTPPQPVALSANADLQSTKNSSHYGRVSTNKPDERLEKWSGILAPEGENEAKIAVSATPHLEPRTATIPSPSPPRASIKARSKTISFTEPPLTAKLSASGEPSFIPSPTLPRLSLISPRGWDLASENGGSLGRSHANPSARKPLPSTFYESEEPKAGDKKGRSTSPPPPKQRYTPPPTILSPMVAAVLSVATPPGSPSVINRSRAQTTGAKPSQKWVKVNATKPSTEELKELLLYSVDRLKSETS